MLHTVEPNTRKSQKRIPFSGFFILSILNRLERRVMMTQSKYNRVRREHHYISHLLITDNNTQLIQDYGSILHAKQVLLDLEYQLNYRKV